MVGLYCFFCLLILLLGFYCVVYRLNFGLEGVILLPGSCDGVVQGPQASLHDRQVFQHCIIGGSGCVLAQLVLFDGSVDTVIHLVGCKEVLYPDKNIYFVNTSLGDLYSKNSEYMVLGVKEDLYPV